MYLSLPRNCWWRKTWCIARKLQAENRKKFKSIKVDVHEICRTKISSHLESFFTVRFWPECEVVIFGGTENKNMFLYKIPDERLLQQRLLIEIKLCSVIVCCTLYHNFWSPLWRMFNTSGYSLLLYHPSHNTSVICTHRLGNRYLVKLKLFCTVNTVNDVKISVLSADVSQEKQVSTN